MEKYHGKYRGTVLSNIDLTNKGRLLVQVPDVLGLNTSSWAMPCVPIAGPQVSMFVLPAVNAGVWVEFESGDPDYPIWTGGFWGSAAEVPPMALAATPGMPNVVMQTKLNTLLLSDLIMGPVGGIMLKSGNAFITINDSGIYISNGKASIYLVEDVITLNNGALTIK
jgi:hypothetical protein